MSGPTPAFSGAAGNLHRPARATVRHEATRSRPGQGAAPAASAAKQCWAAIVEVIIYYLEQGNLVNQTNL